MGTKKVSAVEIISRLRLEQTFHPRLMISDDTETITQVLKAAYIQCVNFRAGEFNETTDLMERLKQVAVWLTTKAEPSLLLYGNTGNGKTTTAKAIQCLTNSIGMYDKDDKPLRVDFIDSNELTHICRDSYKDFRKICDKPFLIVDDIGREPVEVKDFGNVVNPVIELIQHRYDEILPTICTTNLDFKGIKERYGERILDRFKEMMKIIPYTSKSFRYNGKRT